MTIIEQTNRTMLNPEKLDLLTLVGEVKGLESVDDDKVKEINQHLLVKSFDEFLDKFERLFTVSLMLPIRKLYILSPNPQPYLKIQYRKFHWTVITISSRCF